MKFRFGDNCFDLIRLYAAIYVMTTHIIRHSGFGEFPTWFNGVILLFFICGYLTPASLDRTEHIGEFFKKRVIRLYPPLILCMLTGMVIAGLFSGFGPAAETLKWFGGQMLFLHNVPQPGFISDFGTGNLNGSLWTMIYEVQFYIIAAITYKMLNKRSAPFWVILLMLLYGANISITYIFPRMSDFSKMVFSNFCILPYLHIFFTGWFLYRFRESAAKSLTKLKIPILMLFIVWMMLITQFDIKIGEYADALQTFLLCLLAFGVAYSFKLRFKRDITYHLYLWHMIVVNTFVELGLTGKVIYVIGMYAVSLAVSVISCLICEKITAAALRKKA